MLRAERDQAIRAAYKDGLPMADIARVLGMLTPTEYEDLHNAIREVA